MSVDYVAEVDSYGFQDRYWNKGDVARVKKSELDSPELKHFITQKEFDIRERGDEEEEDNEPETLHAIQHRKVVSGKVTNPLA